MRYTLCDGERGISVEQVPKIQGGGWSTAKVRATTHIVLRSFPLDPLERPLKRYARDKPGNSHKRVSIRFGSQRDQTKTYVDSKLVGIRDPVLHLVNLRVGMSSCS